MTKLGTLVLILGMVGCLGPSAPETPVELTDMEWKSYWGQLERRWPAFFEGQCVEAPVLPRMNDMKQAVTFVEVPHEQLETCDYSRKHRKIRIGDDKWESGCVPHELGHAACHLLDVQVCVDFEHRGYESQC